MTLRKAARRASVAALLGLAAGLVTVLPAAPAQAGLPPWGVYGIYNSLEECTTNGDNTGDLYYCDYDASTTKWILWRFNLL
ncbi:hypothetical protein Lfu02_40260 [Longispora fulva]|uniref:Uncharacterized protein n=1 Tax=Longispora fulva TaxID=619741 RepID=A0A8J7KFQ4_9ACTN|nr:hypothetical protein [Longispora fulva]MBG6136485.1 hypothetical protein [Longispora fulva]GIG59654.1 hypothetical protein Lfu02_40260 [Longispora fulva]